MSTRKYKAATIETIESAIKVLDQETTDRLKSASSMSSKEAPYWLSNFYNGLNSNLNLNLTPSIPARQQKQKSNTNSNPNLKSASISTNEIKEMSYWIQTRYTPSIRIRSCCGGQGAGGG